MRLTGSAKRTARMLATGMALMAAAATSADAAPGGVRVGDAAPVPASARMLAKSASGVSTPMAVTVALKPRDGAELKAYAEAVQSSGSVLYHDFISAAQFRARFAPTMTTIRKVEAALRRTGLTVRGVTADDLGIRLTGTGAQVEKAFSIKFGHLRLADGKTAIVNEQAPALTRSISGDVGGVIGLSGLETPTTSYARRPAVSAQSSRTPAIDASQPRTGGPVACSAATKAEAGHDPYSRGQYTAAQVANYYGFPGFYRAGDKGQGVTIALYELEWNLSSDIASYQKCYGTHTQVSYIDVDGGPGKTALKKNPAGSGEAALDIEQLISLAPKARVLVYRGPNANSDNPGSGPYDTYAAIIGQDRASVVSTSWGECEPLETYSDAAQENVLFEEAAVQGQTVTAAAGDDGSEDCDGYVTGGDAMLAADDPGTQPFVISAGGTSLTLGDRSPSEVVWNDSIGAGGGGISMFWPMPNFQKDAATDLGVINSRSGDQSGCSAASGWCREVPDVSASADPVHGYMNFWNGTRIEKKQPGGWLGDGGTSAVAPLWSAFFALTEASKACDGTRLGAADPALYRIAGLGQSAYFRDITTGDNDWTGEGGGLFPATAGYDMASGLGSPRARYLGPALCSQAIKVSGARTRSYRVGSKVSLKLRAALPSGAAGPVRWHSHGLPEGLKLSNGVVSGTLKRAETKNIVFTASAGNSSKKVPAGYYGALAVTWVINK